ncbi:MAG: hypothetical protein HY904_07960 [Deltaproteobacteria bacterium]|nr:hypothetical protein [Deltaproteobacteria bacterium]
MFPAHALLLAALAAPPTVLVLPLDARGGVTRDFADTVGDGLVEALRRQGLAVHALRELEGAAAQTRRAQVAGCEGACITELGAALHADEVVSGSLARVGKEHVLGLSRVVVRTGVATRSLQRRFPADRPAAVLDALPSVARDLVGLAPPGAAVVHAVAAPSAAAPAVRVRVAVLPFENTGKDERLEMLRKGLADMVLADFAACAAVQVVEREELNKVLDELKLQRDKAFDPATAQRVGQLLGAEYLVLGGFFRLGNSFRLDARVVRVETAAVATAQGVSGREEAFMDLEKELAVKLLAGLGTALSEEEQRRLSPARPGTLQDAVEYARAVDDEDAGRRGAARGRAQVLAARLPGMAAALRMVARLGTE